MAVLCGESAVALALVTESAPGLLKLFASDFFFVFGPSRDAIAFLRISRENELGICRLPVEPLLSGFSIVRIVSYFFLIMENY